jgi:hypothetical protein
MQDRDSKEKSERVTVALDETGAGRAWGLGYRSAIHDVAWILALAVVWAVVLHYSFKDGL